MVEVPAKSPPPGKNATRHPARLVVQVGEGPREYLASRISLSWHCGATRTSPLSGVNSKGGNNTLPLGHPTLPSQFQSEGRGPGGGLPGGIEELGGFADLPA